MTNSDQQQATQQPDVRGEVRADLIKRLFAVAISVGAATTLAQMKWVEHGRWPCMEEWQQILILVAAMTATVLSWDGYLVSIKERPLRTFWRFAIDIILVFVYMFLLMTSHLLVWWLFIHALIFVLYAIWDFLTVTDWLDKYYTSLEPIYRRTRRRVYVGGLLDSDEVSRGPIITIVWGLYFWLLFLMNDRALHWLNQPGLEQRIIGTTIVVVLGLWLYRRDKANRYPMCKRLALIALLLIASAAYLTWFPIDATVWNGAGPYIGSASCEL